MTKNRTGEFHSKDKRKLPIFIHSELDDYGLSPIEFRTYARIARRAGGDSKLTESVPNMAESFGVAEVTVRRALQVLCLCRLISKKDRPGWTPEYTLNEQEQWRDKTELKTVREAVLHPKSFTDTLITTDGGTPDHQTQGGVLTTDGGPSSLETDEGTPGKVLPEGTPNTPRASAQEEPPAEPAEELVIGMVDYLIAHNGPLSNRSVQTKAVKWLLENYDPVECEDCLRYLFSEDWRTEAVTWVTVQKQIGNWKRRGSPAKYEPQNGAANGRQTAAEQRATAYDQSFEYLRSLGGGVPEDSGETDPEAETLLLTAAPER